MLKGLHMALSWNVIKVVVSYMKGWTVSLCFPYVLLTQRCIFFEKTIQLVIKGFIAKLDYNLQHIYYLFGEEGDLRNREWKNEICKG